MGWTGRGTDATRCKQGKEGTRNGDMKGTWTKVQADVRECIYLGQVRAMRTRGLFPSLSAWGGKEQWQGTGKAQPCQVRSGQVRFGHRKGRSGVAGETRQGKVGQDERR